MIAGEGSCPFASSPVIDPHSTMRIKPKLRLLLPPMVRPSCLIILRLSASLPIAKLTGRAVPIAHAESNPTYRPEQTQYFTWTRKRA